MRLTLSITWALALTSFCREAYSQGGSAPTLLETQQWIVDKIISNTYSAGGVSHAYRISFSQVIRGNSEKTIMSTEHDQFTGTMYGNGTYKSAIYVRDITGVSFVRKQNSTWLVITLKQDWGPLSHINDDPFTSERSISFILANSINEDDLVNRMKKAFSAMVVMCGGQAFYSREVY